MSIDKLFFTKYAQSRFQFVNWFFNHASVYLTGTCLKLKTLKMAFCLNLRLRKKWKHFCREVPHPTRPLRKIIDNDGPTLFDRKKTTTSYFNDLFSSSSSLFFQQSTCELASRSLHPLARKHIRYTWWWLDDGSMRISAVCGSITPPEQQGSIYEYLYS